MQLANVREILSRIEILIAQSGMMKQDFYDKTGISSASYSQWNTGTHTPSMKKLQRAADVLGVTLEYLLYGDENGNEQEEETKKSPAASGEGMTIEDVKAAIWGTNDPKKLMEFSRIINEKMQELLK